MSSKWSIGPLMASRASFIPTEISGLKFWVKADSLSLSDGDPVGTWADQSGNGNDATQSTAGFKPLYKTNIQHGKPIVRFDGSDDLMEISDTSIILGGQTGMTVFLVISENTVQINKAMFCKWDYQTQGCFAIQTTYVNDFGAGEFMMFVATTLADAGQSRNRSENADLADATFYLLEIVYDGSQATAIDRVKLYKNSTALTMETSFGTTLPSSLLSCTATLKLGCFGGTLSRNWDGDMGEILMYNSALSAADRLKVETYLNSRWGLY